jgi:hypothetical protein
MLLVAAGIVVRNPRSSPLLWRRRCRHSKREKVQGVTLPNVRMFRNAAGGAMVRGGGANRRTTRQNAFMFGEGCGSEVESEPSGARIVGRHLT